MEFKWAFRNLSVVAVLGLVGVFFFTNTRGFSKNYLETRIPSTDKRYETFNRCFKLMEERNAKILVETGRARNGCQNCAGDGCSTVVFAGWAKDHAASLFSIDIDPVAVAESKKVVELINPSVQFFVQDSIAFLRGFNQKIDFLYLDSYDFDFDDPLPSQLHHLNEIMAVYPHLKKETIVMIDDCDLPHGGKGKLAIEFLQNLGWKVLLSRYQTILVYDETHSR